MTQRDIPDRSRNPQRRHRARNVEQSTFRQVGDSRASIAVLAARMIADGTDDFHLAKIKAARQLGLDAHAALPDNHQIEEALRQHHAIFASQTQPRELAALREISINALRWFAEFSPWLSGPVLAGTANRFSKINLELVGVESRSFEMFLLNQSAEFELAETGGQKPRHPGHAASQDRTLIRYEIEFEGALLHISLFASHSHREATHPRNSLFHARMQLTAVEQAFATSGQAGPSSI